MIERDSMDSFDPELRDKHLAEAGQRLPGPDYRQVLGWIHSILRPANYVEIGVRRGESLRMARDGTTCIGIDPSPMIDQEPPGTRIYALTSDEFFARHDLGALLGGPFELAFIDGLHLFEQVLRDFMHLEGYAHRRSVVLLHDCLPLDGLTSSRSRTTAFYSGDVWKAALALRRQRPDLELVTVRAAPTGLCLVRGLDPESRHIEESLPELVAEYRDFDFDYYSAHLQEMPPQLANDVGAVREWLSRPLGRARISGASRRSGPG
jgi:Methyltransferase domain